MTHDIEALKIISELTLELTKIRQKGCGQLCVESFAPELFKRLLIAYRSA